MINLLYMAPIKAWVQLYLGNFSTTAAKILFPFSIFGISGNKVGLISLISIQRNLFYLGRVYFCINEATMKWYK